MNELEGKETRYLPPLREEEMSVGMKEERRERRRKEGEGGMRHWE